MPQIPLPLIRTAVEQMLHELRAAGRLSLLAESKGALALSLADALDRSEPLSRPNLSRELRLLLDSLDVDEGDHLANFDAQLRAIGLDFGENA